MCLVVVEQAPGGIPRPPARRDTSASRGKRVKTPGLLPAAGPARARDGLRFQSACRLTELEEDVEVLDAGCRGRCDRTPASITNTTAHRASYPRQRRTATVTASLSPASHGGHSMASASSTVIGSSKPAPHEQVIATVMEGVVRSKCSRPALMVYDRAPWRSWGRDERGEVGCSGASSLVDGLLCSVGPRYFAPRVRLARHPLSTSVPDACRRSSGRLPESPCRVIVHLRALTTSVCRPQLAHTPGATRA